MADYQDEYAEEEEPLFADDLDELDDDDPPPLPPPLQLPDSVSQTSTGLRVGLGSPEGLEQGGVAQLQLV